MGYGQEILEGVWRFTTVHPAWVDDDDGWEPVVAWWGIQTDRGLLLVDPLVDDWDELDGVIADGGGCAGIVRTLHWHQRSIDEAATRYAAQVWGRPWPISHDRPLGYEPRPYDRAIEPGKPITGDVLPFDAGRDDEVVLWFGGYRALFFGDVLMRDQDGALRLCPESWIERAGGADAVRDGLAPLLELDVLNVFVAHGPLVLGGGREALAQALAP